MKRERPIPLLATAFACPHTLGFLPTQSGERHPDPLSTEQWIDLALSLGLNGVEIPLPPAARNPESLARLRDHAGERGAMVFLSTGIVDPADLAGLADAAEKLGPVCAKTVRAVLSRVLCGDRRQVEGGWPTYLAGILERLKEAVPLLRDRGLVLALENHQDATSHDLIRLCEASDPDVVGVCLDAGNPLAVAEDPVEFARRIAPYARHAHLKDYTIHFAPSGFRLVRCAAGDGVVDFPAVLEALTESPHPVTLGVEVGAHTARHVKLLEDGWWECHEPRSAQDLLPALRILWERGLPPESEWRSPWERDESSESVSADEISVLTRSAAYLLPLVRGVAPGTRLRG